MGNSAPQTVTPQQGQDARLAIQHELPKFIIQAQISHGKFLKSFRCKLDGMPVIVKVYIKRDPDEDLSHPQECLRVISSKLNPLQHPNVLPYHLPIEYQRKVAPDRRANRVAPATAAFLVRQHFLSSLYDRLSTRPFLSVAEKKWLVYQLFRAVEQLHSVGVCHGDIKTENVMVTSWHWVTLVDMASFKPTYLLDNQPAEVNYYFPSEEGRPRCYLAPERFISEDQRLPHSLSWSPGRFSGQTSSSTDLVSLGDSSEATTHPSGKNAKLLEEAPLTQAMDVFSLGCVIAEVFLDGEAPLDLPALLHYRANPDPEAVLPKLNKLTSCDERVCRLVQHMTRRDPLQRKTVEEYRTRMEKNGPSCLFPPSFGGFLFKFICNLHLNARTPDDRITLVCRNYGQAVHELAGIADPSGQAFFNNYLTIVEGKCMYQSSNPDDSQKAIPTGTGGYKEEHLNDLEATTEDLTQLMEETQRLINELEEKQTGFPETQVPFSRRSWGSNEHGLIPLSSTRTQRSWDQHVQPVREAPHGTASSGELLIILVQVVCSCLHHLRFPSSKLLALLLLVRLSQHLDDEAKLQRLVPYLVTLLEDQFAAVRASAVRALRGILQTVKEFPPSEAQLFPKYLFPALNQSLPVDSDELVRVAFAESIASFAETSRRFLDKAHSLPQQRASELDGKEGDGKVPVLVSGSYDRELQELQAQVSRWVMPLVASTDAGFGSGGGAPSTGTALAKRALLQDITKLCNFFGQENTLLSLLPQLITFLNDRDWELRCAFCKHITSVCALVGGVATAQFVLPCVENALTDSHLLVATSALHCLTALTQMGLLTREVMVERVRTVAPLLAHPSTGLRGGSLALCGSIGRNLGRIDSYVFLLPILRPYLRYDLIGGEVDQDTIYKALLPPVSSEAYSKALAREIEKVSSLQKKDSRLYHFSLDMNAQCSFATDSCEENDESAPLPKGYEGSRQSSSASISEETSTDQSAGTPQFGDAFRGVCETNADDYEGGLFKNRSFDFGDNERSSSSQMSPRAAVAISTLRKSTSELDMQPEEPIFVPLANTLLGVSSKQPFVEADGNEGLVTRDVALQQHQQHLAAGDRHKLALLKDYIHMVTVKLVNRQRAQDVSLSSSTGNVSSPSKTHTQQTSEALLHEKDPIKCHLNTLPESLAQSIFIPDQKFTPLCQLPSPEIEDQMTNLKQQLLTTPDKTLPPMILQQGFAACTRPSGAAISVASRSGVINQEDLSDGGRASPAPQHIKNRLAAQNIDTETQSKQDAQESTDPSVLLRRLIALGVPPLPPDLGSLTQRDGRVYSLYSETLQMDEGAMTAQRENLAAMQSSVGNTTGTSGTRTKSMHLFSPLASLTEHTGPVNRLCVSQDQAFFASSSSDGSTKIWDLRDMDTETHLKSRTTHVGPGGEILDACMIDNSHSIVTASSKGHVQVWRVDIVSSSSWSKLQSAVKGNAVPKPTVEVPGLIAAKDTTVIRTVCPQEGPVLSLQHYNGDHFAMIVYATQKGNIHGWDLRSKSEPWVLKIPPEFGFLTAMALGTDKNWLVVGTNRGYILIWDIRFQLLSKVWRHSSHGPIYRLATCGRLPFENYPQAKPLPRVFISAGANEVAAWDIMTGGFCRQCFRALPPAKTAAEAIIDTKLPKLEPVEVPTGFQVPKFSVSANATNQSPVSIKAIMGRVSQEINSHLITGGSDGFIRFWDYHSSSKCYTICGYEFGQPKSIFEKYVSDVDETKQLFVCRDSALPSSESTPSELLPVVERRGIVPAPSRHSDAVLDLKVVELPFRMLLSSGRDGVVKLWPGRK